MRRLESAAEGMVPHHRHRPGARPGRASLRFGRQSALSVRRVLPPGKSPDHEAHFPSGIRGFTRAAGRRISQPFAIDAAIVVSRRHRLAQSSGTDAGDL